MKIYTFSATTDLGGDGETFFDVELTDQESVMLEEYGKKSSVYYEGFSSCKELQDLYNRVYKIAIEILTEELRDYEEFEDDDEYDEWSADDTYSVEVLWPKEFEEALIDE